MTGTVARGGSSTISGVVYQLLRSLLHVAQLRVAVPLTLDVSCPEGVTIVLEPRGGGGDLQLKGDSSLVVEQIKARSDGGTWSLREVIEDVLPDLFLAVDADTSGAGTFRFVTEGRMGAWRDVYDNFFRDIRNRTTSTDPLVALDDQITLSFVHHTGLKDLFFPEPCTERSLFLKIAEVISERPVVKARQLGQSELHKRVNHLLGHFEFVGGQDVHVTQESIDALLLAIVDKLDDIPSIRDHLALELAKASTVGGVEIDAAGFLSDHGLDATPLTDWAGHIESARRLVARAIDRRRYDEQLDIRARELPSAPGPGGVLVITGESGTGKSWMLSALAERSTGPYLPILVESEGTADATLKKCAELFWNDVHDGDEVLPLSRIAKRLKQLANLASETGLAVFIDSVRTYEEARRLVKQDWDAWSSSLILACRLEHAKSLQMAYPDCVEVYQCNDFTWEQLHDYVGRRLETGWAEIPIDVRETLRRPLLASIYCEEFGETGWESPSEYELYQRVWERLSTGEQSDWPLDAGFVEQLARGVTEGSPYPWSQCQLLDAGIDNDVLIRLQRIGWFVAAGDRYQVFHDRLLQWAVARSLCSDLRERRITAESLVSFVTDQFRGVPGEQQVMLGYVPMDVLWMLSQGTEGQLDVAVLLLESLESVDHHHAEMLYAQLVPTLGTCVADAVYRRVCSYDGYPWIQTRLAECLVIVGRVRLEEFARPLIESDDRRMQRRGVSIVRLAACPALLDQLWQTHIAGQRDPTAFGDEDTKTWSLYEETFDALKRSVREAPNWIRMAIERADVAAEPVHDLNYLVANLNDGGVTWRAAKSLLFDKTSDHKPCSLVANISRYRDTSEVEWLQQWIGSGVDRVASPALQALSRVDPDAAVAALRRMDPLDLSMCRAWSFAEVFERRPAATRAEMFEWMKDSDDPWKLLLAFQNRENDISPEQLEIALDALTATLALKLHGEGDPRRGVHIELAFLAELAAPEHLQVLRARRGTSFEATLRDYVLSIGPQLGRWSTGIERSPAMVILNLIGGEGLTTVVNEFLDKGDQYGKHDAIKWAAKRPDDWTFDRLREIALSDECWPGTGDRPFPVNQNDAMKVLAQHGRWESVSDGLMKWGMRTSPDLKDCPEPINEPWVDTLRPAVETTPTSGNVLALGTVGGVDDCSRIRRVFNQCDAESDLAHACIIALENLDDRSDEAVAKVVQHLNIERQRYSVKRMLQHAGTPRAWNALFEDLKSHFDFVTALNLINLSEHADAAVEIALSHIPTHRGIDGHSLVKLFLKEIRPEGVRERILSDPHVRELFHRAAADAEGRYWCVGSKANAIECMAAFAPESAFAAACHVLLDSDAHDRERYPSILVRIDRERGIKWLIDHYPKIDSQLVCFAIGRTLENGVPLATIIEMAHAAEERTRVAGAMLAGWAALDDSIDVALERSLDDQSADVIRAAVAARQRRRDRRTVVALAHSVVEETDPSERRVFLDALIGFVDPGAEHGPTHPAIQEALQVVSGFEVKNASEVLKKRRKKLVDELKKAKV